MKVLSIDIGIKNLAYVILEVTNTNANANANLDKNSIVNGSQDFKIIKWDVINLCNKFISCSSKTCTKQACFHKNDTFFPSYIYLRIKEARKWTFSRSMTQNKEGTFFPRRIKPTFV